MIVLLPAAFRVTFRPGAIVTVDEFVEIPDGGWPFTV